MLPSAQLPTGISGFCCGLCCSESQACTLLCLIPGVCFPVSPKNEAFGEKGSPVVTLFPSPTQGCAPPPSPVSCHRWYQLLRGVNCLINRIRWDGDSGTLC